MHKQLRLWPEPLPSKVESSAEYMLVDDDLEEDEFYTDDGEYLDTYENGYNGSLSRDPVERFHDRRTIGDLVGERYRSSKGKSFGFSKPVPKHDELVYWK
jgi:hypothetical protein